MQLVIHLNQKHIKPCAFLIGYTLHLFVISWTQVGVGVHLCIMENSSDFPGDAYMHREVHCFPMTHGMVQPIVTLLS